MGSPPANPSHIDLPSGIDLQGASCMTGGILHGHAQGNVYNIADNLEVTEFTGPVKGNIHVYNKHGNPDSIDPYMLVKHEVTPNIGPVLEKLASQYSPVCSMFSIL